MLNVSEWKDYKQGEASCYSWKLERVQVKIQDSHYINNFVDYVKKDNQLLYNIDKIILLGDGNPIAIYPKNSKEIKDITVYLDSIKGTDIHTVIVSLAEFSGMFVDSDLIEETLSTLNAQTKIQVRFIIGD